MGYPSSFEKFVVYEPWNPAEYRELKLIAKAIHGSVHLAEHLPTGELRAIKKIPNNNIYKRPDGQLENALVEIGASLYLSRHAVAAVSGIIQTYGAFRDDADTYLITGGELFDEVARLGHIREEQARRIGLQLLLAVKSLHDNGVCHRDLSLENTLIHADGTIRVIDFGQAEPLYDDAGHEKYLVNAAGKLYYRAPEMYSGAYRGTAADMFAVGVELFILVFGTPPWLQATPADDRFVFIQSYPDGFERLLARWKRQHFVSEEFRDLIKQMIRAEPSKRPSADEALAHSWLTRCDPTLDFTLLSCSTWFLPQADRDASPERPGFEDSVLSQSRVASRDYPNETACAATATHANFISPGRAASFMQELVKASLTESPPHHGNNCVLNGSALSADAPLWQPRSAPQIAFAQNTLSPGDKVTTLEDKGFPRTNRMPTSDRISVAMGHNSYVKLAFSRGDTCVDEKCTDFPTRRYSVSTSPSYTRRATQPSSAALPCNQPQPTHSSEQECAFLYAPRSQIERCSVLEPQSSKSSTIPTAGNTIANAPVTPIKKGCNFSLSVSPSRKLPVASAHERQRHPAQTRASFRGNEKRNGVKASAAPNRSREAEVKDISVHGGAKVVKNRQSSGFRRGAGDSRGQAKQGKTSGREDDIMERKSKAVETKAKKCRPREAEASPFHSVVAAGASSSANTSLFPLHPGGCPASVNTQAFNGGSSRRESVHVGDLTGYGAAATAGAKPQRGSADFEKATNSIAGKSKKAALQRAALPKIDGLEAKIGPQSCTSSKLSAPSGSPFSLRLRALSLLLANRFTGFRLCRSSNQENSTTKKTGSTATTNGHAEA